MSAEINVSVFDETLSMMKNMHCHQEDFSKASHQQKQTDRPPIVTRRNGRTGDT